MDTVKHDILILTSTTHTVSLRSLCNCEGRRALHVSLSSTSMYDSGLGVQTRDRVVVEARNAVRSVILTYRETLKEAYLT